jgi:hypothetical protein
MAEQNGPRGFEAPKPGEAFLLIKLTTDGLNTMVSGVIQNKGLSYMLLELARDAIQTWHEQNKSLIQQAAHLPGENV